MNLIQSHRFFKVRMKLWLYLAICGGMNFNAWTQIAEVSPQVRRSWEDDYTSLKTTLTKPPQQVELSQTGENRPDVAHIQSLIWRRPNPRGGCFARTQALLIISKPFLKHPI